jgi:hypothetical protein
MNKKIFLSVILALTLAVGTANAVVTERILNGDLEAWTGGVPDSWDMQNRDAFGAVNSSPTYIISQEIVDIHSGSPGTKALLCDRSVSGEDYTYRYFANSNTINPLVGNGTYSCWQKGASPTTDPQSNCRTFRASSTDLGVTWVVDNSAALGGVTAPLVWTHATATITQFQTAGELYKIGCHSFGGKAWIDDMSLLGDDGIYPLSISAMDPPVSYYLTKTVNLTATPAGGSGTYTQVQFDIGNNGSYEYTDPSAPFQYVWDTAATQSGKGTVDVKVTVTDSTLATGSTVFTYTVDNRFGGRVECMTNGGFDSWQGTSPNDRPEGWSEHQMDVVSSYGQDTDIPAGGTAPSLQVTFSAFTAAFRCALIWKGFQNVGGQYVDHQVCYWGKGVASSLRYWTSTDGSTWTDSGLTAASAGTPDWIYSIGAVVPTLGGSSEWQTISTDQTEYKNLFDDISWMASPPTAPPLPPTPTPTPEAVTSAWGLYE